MIKQRKAQKAGKPRRKSASPATNGERGQVREANEGRLLDAAETIFAKRGFTGATTAAIAARAKLPKANLHYYFRTKEELYRAVLANVLGLWMDELDRFTPEREPAEAFAEYIAAKIRWSQTRPNASKVFANEILHGAAFLDGYLSRDLRRRVQRYADVVRDWIKRGKMPPIDPTHLLFQLWAMTQHYADFEVQVRAVLGRDRLSDADFTAARDNITTLVLRGLVKA
jgi:TetR/AcrR family transcriptional regulator